MDRAFLLAKSWFASNAGLKTQAEAGLLAFARRYVVHLALASIVFMGLALRMHHIDRLSLWWDEGWSLWFARQDIVDLAGDIFRRESNPPLYYILLKGWIALFGDGDGALRSLSAVFGAVTPLVLYSAARRALGGRAARWIGLLAATLFALAFIQLRFAQEARVYTLYALSVSLVIASAAWIIRSEHEDGRRGLQPYLLFGLSLALCLWCHYTGIVYAGLACGLITVWWMARRRFDLATFRRLALSAVIFLVLAAEPLYMFTHYALTLTQDFWLTAPNKYKLVWEVEAALGSLFELGTVHNEALLQAAMFGVWPVLGAKALIARRDGGSVWCAALFAVMSVGAIAAIAAITYVMKPIMLPRVLAPAQAGWILLTACAPMAASLRWRPLVAGLIVISYVLGAGSHLARDHYLTGVEDWRGMYDRIDAQTEGPARLIVHSVATELMSHYADISVGHGGEGTIVVAGVQPLSVIDMHSAKVAGDTPFFDGDLTHFAQRLEAALVSDGRSWVVMREKQVTPDVAAMLARHGMTEPTIRSEGALFAYRVPPSQRP